MTLALLQVMRTSNVIAVAVVVLIKLMSVSTVFYGRASLSVVFSVRLIYLVIIV